MTETIKVSQEARERAAEWLTIHLDFDVEDMSAGEEREHASLTRAFARFEAEVLERAVGVADDFRLDTPQTQVATGAGAAAAMIAGRIRNLGAEHG